MVILYSAGGFPIAGQVEIQKHPKFVDDFGFLSFCMLHLRERGPVGREYAFEGISF